MKAFTPRQWLLLALAATLVFRVWLSAVAPVTADEAYFILWGRSPALGYYDHPPMVGWLLAPLAAISEAAWLMRLPAVLVPPLAALLVGAALRRWFGRDRETADLAALAVLLMPMNVWNVLITTDTPLVLFSVASLLVFTRAAEKDSNGMFLASGVLLGLAFLSKYFAVLLGLAYLVWALSSRKPKAFLLVFLGGLPFGLLNLYWNAEACWCNVMFNAINRHEGDGSGWSAATPVLYAASLAYLAAPLLWFAWRERRQLGWSDPARRALILAWVVPLVVFALLSPVKRIGLHWLLSFVPALVLSLAFLPGRRALVSSVRVFAALAVLHVLVAVTTAALPLEAWKSMPLLAKIYPRLLFPGRIAELMTALQPALPGRTLATDSYGSSALLGFHLRQLVPVFGIGTSHARQDDIETDWRQYDGKDFIVLRRQLPLEQDYRPYFRDIEIREIPLSGGTYYAVLGRGFSYAAYHMRILTEVRDRFYRIPAPLPVERCYFFERYFPR